MKGATGNDNKVYIIIDISIHAPVKGATALQLASIQGCLISIHAPVKGAT